MVQGQKPAISKNAQHRQARKRKKVRMINRELQMRYAWLLGLSSLFMMMVFGIPAWYFVKQNYEMFSKIAYDTHPGLIAHLDREQTWLACLLIIGTLASGLITAVTSLRITTLLLGPLSAMEGHMRKITRGDWSSSDFRVRESDDLREVTGTYAYMYKVLRAQAETEVKILEQIVIDPQQVDSSRAWLTLINLKRKQLGLSAIEISASNASAQDSRRAS